MNDRSSSYPVEAVGTLLVGLGAAVSLTMIAIGRQRELYPFGIAAAVTGAFVGATKVLGGEAPPGRPRL